MHHHQNVSAHVAMAEMFGSIQRFKRKEYLSDRFCHGERILNFIALKSYMNHESCGISRSFESL